MPQTDGNQASDPRHDPLMLRKQQYALTMIAVAALLMIQLQNPWIPTAMRVIFVAAVLLGFLRWSAAILLALIQLDLLLGEPPRAESAQQVLCMVTSFLTIVLIMTVSRLRSAQELTGVRTIRQLLRSTLFSLLNPDPDLQSAHDARNSQGLVSGAAVFRTCTKVLILMLAAGTLLLLFPEDTGSGRQLGLTSPALRVIQIGLVLFTLYFACLVLPGEFRWRRLTRHQAGIYLRSLYVGWAHRDLRMIVRHRLRRRRRNARLRRRDARKNADATLKETS